MTPDWVHLCRADDLVIAAPCIKVQFADGRHHRVTIEDCGDEYQLTRPDMRAFA